MYIYKFKLWNREKSMYGYPARPPRSKKWDKNKRREDKKKMWEGMRGNWLVKLLARVPQWWQGTTYIGHMEYYPLYGIKEYTQPPHVHIDVYVCFWSRVIFIHYAWLLFSPLRLLLYFFLLLFSCLCHIFLRTGWEKKTRNEAHGLREFLFH